MNDVKLVAFSEEHTGVSDIVDIIFLAVADTYLNVISLTSKLLVFLMQGASHKL